MSFSLSWTFIALWQTRILEVIDLLKDTNLEMGVLVDRNISQKKKNNFRVIHNTLNCQELQILKQSNHV
jgi:hypothetical protein